MQPENSQPSPMGPEQLPQAPAYNGEAIPSLPPLDAGIERGAERYEQRSEGRASVSDAASLAAPIAVPQVQVPIAPQDDTTQVASNSPLVAADEDLIEKEWVDKAKEIIQHTKDDPHARTQQVNQLQRDYLQKRYGRVVGASE